MVGFVRRAQEPINGLRHQDSGWIFATTYIFSSFRAVNHGAIADPRLHRGYSYSVIFMTSFLSPLQGLISDFQLNTPLHPWEKGLGDEVKPPVRRRLHSLKIQYHKSPSLLGEGDLGGEVNSKESLCQSHPEILPFRR
jgi:hypothetical protein